TSSISATMRVLDGNVALLRARRPFATFAGQRVVLRRSSRKGNVTIGGGIVLDPHPRSWRRATTFFFLAPTPIDRVRALVADARHAGITLSDIERRASWDDHARERLAELVTANAVVTCEGRYFD